MGVTQAMKRYAFDLQRSHGLLKRFCQPVFSQCSASVVSVSGRPNVETADRREWRGPCRETDGAPPILALSGCGQA